MMALKPLDDWAAHPDPGTFPYREIVAEFHRVGKHFVADDVLRALAGARERQARPTDLLGRFLNVALDKWDKRYDYPTYIALDLVLPAGGISERYDRLLAQLVTDVLHFETATADGHRLILPRMRPPRKTVDKRCHHGLRVLAPVLTRLGLPVPSEGDPLDRARAAVDLVAATMSGEDRLLMDTTVLPVDTFHDEYLFIRVLQSFEVFFALASARLRGTIQALSAEDAGGAIGSLDLVSARFSESAPLFSMLATMQVEAFRDFRRHTEGASAIQSPGYKTMESLCRSPDPQRLHSPAYLSVPAVREEVLAGRFTVDDAVVRAAGLRTLDPADMDALAGARQRFAAASTRWRRTHHRLAARMLGAETGSGYTAGVPYLADVLDIPVFDPLRLPGSAAAEHV
ncbi:hypothetical protein GCM10022224_008360 [Nonomuraea antimicrobica]|uniref:Tryptophan 2,3-dioxygenase n=1 Tax=Nonomuraea antimicrobica TaxID=561173 RepID=A0ABP7B4N0_9ACTN